MNIASRGIRNAFRNVIRSFSIVVILGLSIGMILSMLVARQAVEQKITEVKSTVGNTVSISPAGARGFEGGGNPLTVDQINSIKSLSHVASVTSSLGDRLTSDTTTLQSAVDAGSLGRRFSGNNGTQFQAPPDRFGASVGTRSFTPPVRVTGVDSVSDTSIYGSSNVTYMSGAVFDPGKDENVAVIGKNLATKNNLSVSSTFTAYNTDIKVVGIYDTGTEFLNNTVIMPLVALQRLSAQPGAITSATAKIDSLDNLATATTAIKDKLGSTADVTNSQDVANNAVAPLESVKSVALFSLVAALIAGGTIILLTMLMIVRERRREIGVMKAIGSSNAGIMGQFIAEAITLTTLGLIAGFCIAFVAATPITNALVTNSTSSAQSSTQGGPGGGFGRGMRNPQLRQVTGNNLRSIQSSLDMNTAMAGIGSALFIAIIGSAIPAYFISKIRPSEVMRAE